MVPLREAQGFLAEKIPLHLHSPTVATQLAVASHHPMAGDDNGQGVLPQSLPYRPLCPSFAKLLSYPAIAPGLSVWDKPGELPHLTLENGSRGKVKLIRKGCPLTGKVTS
jgi:hypothetical protein